MKQSLLAPTALSALAGESWRAPHERDLIGNRKLLCGSWRERLTAARPCSGAAAAADDDKILYVVRVLLAGGLGRRQGGREGGRRGEKGAID